MFKEKVYTLCKKIPHGKVTTYKEIAKALNTKAYQAIGQAFKKNPDPKEVPCFKVILSNGKKEGIEIKNNKIDLKKYLFSFHEQYLHLQCHLFPNSQGKAKKAIFQSLFLKLWKALQKILHE